MIYEVLPGSRYLLHLVFITVHDADTEHQLLCIIIIKDAIQVVTKTWWGGGAMRKITPVELASYRTCLPVTVHLQLSPYRVLFWLPPPSPRTLLERGRGNTEKEKGVQRGTGEEILGGAERVHGRQ